MSQSISYVNGPGDSRLNVISHLISDVIGPDDNRLKVNNSAFTNAAASLSIHYARYAACALGRDERNEVPQEWMDVALNLNLPYMHTKRYHEEFDEYDMRPGMYSSSSSSSFSTLFASIVKGNEDL